MGYVSYGFAREGRKIYLGERGSEIEEQVRACDRIFSARSLLDLQFAYTMFYLYFLTLIF